MRLTKIYCGSNNKTGFLEVDRIRDVLNRWLKSYTLTMAKGFWKGKTEDTAIIEIYGDYNLGIVSSLKQALGQDVILVAEQLMETKLI